MKDDNQINQQLIDMVAETLQIELDKLLNQFSKGTTAMKKASKPTKKNATKRQPKSGTVAKKTKKTTKKSPAVKVKRTNASPSPELTTTASVEQGGAVVMQPKVDVVPETVQSTSPQTSVDSSGVVVVNPVANQ